MGSDYLKRTLAKTPAISIAPSNEEDYDGETVKVLSEKDQRIENHFMKELNLLNIDRIVNALQNH